MLAPMAEPMQQISAGKSHTIIEEPVTRITAAGQATESSFGNQAFSASEDLAVPPPIAQALLLSAGEEKKEKPLAWYKKNWVWFIIGVAVTSAVISHDENNNSGSVTIISPAP